MSDWIALTHVITLDRDIGNFLAARIDPDVGGGSTFDVEPNVRRISDGTPAWYASSLMKQRGVDMVSEFKGPGPYPLLNGVGVADPQVAAGKAVVLVETYPRATAPDWQAFIAEQGYEVVE